MSAFGFDVSNVFGDGGFGSARKGRKNGNGKNGKNGKRKPKNIGDGFDCPNCNDQGFSDQGFGGLGDNTFSNIDALGIGSDFSEKIGSRAGKANGKRGGFLDVIGSQQVGIPRVTGRGRASKKGRGRSKTTRG